MTSETRRPGPAAWPAPEDILYEDNHLLAVHKPAGLLTQGDRTGADDATTLLRDWIKRRDAKPGAVWLNSVHRLDRPVAGLLLFAKTSKAASRLAAVQRRTGMTRDYLAVVELAPDTRREPALAAALEAPGPSAGLTLRDRLARPGSGEEQDAALRLWVLARRGTRALLQLRLITGRRHQIRVQLAQRGLPIVGDRRYGRGAAANEGEGPSLLAWRLVVPHPTRGEAVELRCPLPSSGAWWDFAEEIKTIDAYVHVEDD